MSHHKHIVLAAVVLLLALAGCSRSGADALAGTKWALVSYGPPGQPTPVAVPATAEFADGKIGGNGGCNGFGGSYSASGSSLTVSELMQTLMACDEPRMSVEAAYMAALQSAASYSIAGDALTIGYAGGELRFARQAPVADRPLEGRWQLVSFANGDVATMARASPCPKPSSGSPGSPQQ